MRDVKIPGLDRVAFPAKTKKALLSALRVYGLCAISLFCFQRFLLFRPMEAPSDRAPSIAGSAQYWRFAAVAPTGPDVDFAPVCAADAAGKTGAVAYFPGNAEQASSVEFLASSFPGCAVYALDYPSYEGAAGSPSEGSVMAGAEDLLRKMGEDGVDPARVILVGRSFGSGPAARAAAGHPCLLAGLLTPYASLADVAFGHFPIFPTQWLALDRFDASATAHQARCPAMVVSAGADSVIPERHAYALWRMWNPKMESSWVSVPGATHDDIGGSAEAWSAMRAGALRADSLRRGLR